MREFKKKIELACCSIQPFVHINGGDIKVIDISDDLNIDIELSGLFRMEPFNEMIFKKIEDLFKLQVPEINNINFTVEELKY